MGSYYLPDGRWINYFTGEEVTGGAWREEYHDYLSIPLWVKENAVVPVQLDPGRASDSYKNKLELRIFGLKDQAETKVYENQKEILYIKVERKEKNLLVHCSRECRIRFVNSFVKPVGKNSYEMQGNDTVIDVTEKEFVCETGEIDSGK